MIIYYNTKEVGNLIKTITTNLDIVEMMLFYWESVKEREKIVESFIIEVSEKEDMEYLYNENFNKDSVRKVLSAISNREKLNHPSKEEGRFWNNNMWMLEDLSNMNNMVRPLKLLNLDYLKDELESKYEELKVVFIPGHIEEYYIDENKLVINFFRIMVDMMDESIVKISGKPLEEYIVEKLKEME